MDTGLISQPPLTQLLTVFNAGLITSLTPCVYPLIPVTLAVFGASEARRLRALALSCVYVLGLAFTYTALGMFSAQTGTLFGSLLGNPWVVGSLCIFLILLSFYSLDFFQLDFAYRLQTAASRIGGRGYRGAFLMGAVSGLVAAPCAGPVLVVVLGIAAASQNALWGAILLFTYSIGFGVLFIVLSAFPGILKRLPRSGDWLHWIKFITAVALFLVALMLLSPFIPNTTWLEFIASKPLLLLVFLAIAFFIASVGYRKNLGSLKCLAAICLAVTILPLINSPKDLTWQSNFELALAQAKNRNTIALVDLYADWCLACKEFDKVTFSDSNVKVELEKLSLARLDFTISNDITDKITEQYGIVGLPSLLFLDSAGNEIPDSRLTGFIGPNEFIQHLKHVLAASETN